ncbi:MAG: glycosyl transferase family 1 [Flavobacteriaceae bacterium]|nr:MAG: glycosyl transferase family 1 [Flavobacteriaceae bacterium]
MQKVLIITYYWPPAGGPGVQRWLKFVKYLRDFNIEPVVYIPENPNYPIIDDTFLNEIPEGITIYKKPIFEPYRLASLFSKKKTKRISSGIIATKNQSFLEKTMLWVRGNFFIPDARKYWVKPSITFLKSIIEKEGIRTIITTGPPHSVHLIGLGLKKKLNLQWLVDFRDPWTSIGYHKKLKLSKASQAKHKALEYLVLTSADKIIVTSSTTKSEFEVLTKKPIRVITNGFDVDYAEEVVLDIKFTLSHIGSLLGGRNPKNLWKVISELITEDEAFEKAISIQFAGVVSQEVMESIEAAGLASYANFLGYVSHEEAISIQRKSQVLLLVEIDSPETTGIIPGKLFEYLAAKRPILGIGPKEWEVVDMVTDTNSGHIYNYEAESDLKSVILDWFLKYQQQDLSVTSIHVQQYSRRELTGKLAEYIQWESY